MKFKLAVLILIGVACLGAMPLTPQSAQVDTASGAAYVIQPNDALTVFVFSHPELSQDVVVQPDGRISTPLIQSIQAAGFSAEQLKPAIEKRLTDLIDVPNVTVIVRAIQSYRIFVTGKVQKPGLLTFERPLTVLQALSLAGGFQDYAKKGAITIIRTIPPEGKDPQKEVRYTFNWDEVIKGVNPVQNRFLLTGDVVIVQ